MAAQGVIEIAAKIKADPKELKKVQAAIDKAGSSAKNASPPLKEMGESLAGTAVSAKEIMPAFLAEAAAAQKAAEAIAAQNTRIDQNRVAIQDYLAVETEGFIDLSKRTEEKEEFSEVITQVLHSTTGRSDCPENPLLRLPSIRPALKTLQLPGRTPDIIA